MHCKDLSTSVEMTKLDAEMTKSDAKMTKSDAEMTKPDVKITTDCHPERKPRDLIERSGK